MRATDIVLLLIAINIGMGVVSASTLGLYQAPRTELEGVAPSEEGFPGDNSLYFENTAPGSELSSMQWVNPLTEPGNFMIIVSSIMLVAFIGSATGASVLRIIGLGLFAGIYWWMWTFSDAMLESILSHFHGLMWFKGLVAMIYFIVFTLAIIQMVTGQSTEAMF